MKTFGIGLLGFGTVGAGVIEGLQRNGELLSKRLNAHVQIKGIADLDLTTDRGVEVDSSLLTNDANALIDSPDVDVVIELVGGTTVAKEFILRALKQGKPVITANKALLAEYGEELFQAAREFKTDLYYEAAVAGGIPVIRALREGLVANHIESMYGILNGTCNYILTRMEQEHLEFDQVLKEAQEAGYAEAEPSLDIDGIDTAHKAVILTSLAYGLPVTMDDVHIDGIRGFNPMDIEMATQLGYRIKLLACIKCTGGTIELRVHPALVPLTHTLASVSGVYNAVMVRGDIVGDTLYYGQGAGRHATASAVLGDLADIVRNLSKESPRRVPPLKLYDHYESVLEMNKVKTRYYLRLSLLDRPGMVAEVARILGEHHISIASMIQKDIQVGGAVPVILLTHRAVEKDLRAAMNEIAAIEGVDDQIVMFRVEDFE